MKLYRGIVEDNNHPDKNGQVRVRIFGIHTDNSGDDFNQIKTEDLPWAQVMGSTELGLNSGIGLSSVPRQGTMVWCFLDNDDDETPVIIGTATGVSSVPDGTAFKDPAGVYPLTDRIGQPDTNPDMRSSTSYTETMVLETPGNHKLYFDPSTVRIFHSTGSVIEIDSTGKIFVTSVNDIAVSANGDIDMTAGGNINMNATTINLNS